MKYKIKKETKPTLSTFGKYKAVAVHRNTLDTEQIINEMTKNSVLDKGTVISVLIDLSEVITRHLKEGDKVKLNDFGLMKLEIESEKVDNADDFKPKKHIKGVRLHFIPESINGKQPLYNNIQFEKEKPCSF